MTMAAITGMTSAHGHAPMSICAITSADGTLSA